MKKLPIGIQNFKEITTGDYIYVDKTQYIYDMINGAKYYFLSRPRRFGKSLLLDTIGEVFGGCKELFKGLWIYDSDHDFQKHPVIRIDMSNISNDTSKILKTSLYDEINYLSRKEQLDISGSEPSTLFKRLIEGLYQKYGQRVVVLIDEYDKPILDHITDIKTADANRKVLRGFYGILKSMDPYLRFTFITGVSKFTKTSIFSGLNNLKDITMLEDYANICGIPVESLEEYFSEHIERLSTHKRFTQYDNIHNEILAWYDGYSWDGETKLLNPFSLLNFFDQKRFAGFWYTSGTPGFLLDLIKKKPESYWNLKNIELTEYMLDSVEIDKITIEPLLFQTGYLTIMDIPLTPGTPIYTLDIPNFEVREAFNLHVLSALTENDDVRVWQVQAKIRKALLEGDLQKMLEILRGLFASIPYELHVDVEAYYHSIFYTFMTLLGFDMDVEVSVSKGRVDAILELDDKVYVMEFKYKKCPPGASEEERRKLFEKALDEAMGQINDRGYAEKFMGSGKVIYRAAFAFLGRDNIELSVDI
ncbi:MAG: ATP-binding protein [Oscillospiraceae bacterium]|nr:ATP-binding protein [Oscillospiraceae bacterium]